MHVREVISVQHRLQSSLRKESPFNPLRGLTAEAAIIFLPVGAAARQQALSGGLQRRWRVPGGLRLLPLPRWMDRRRLRGTPAAPLRQEVRKNLANCHAPTTGPTNSALDA